MTRQKFGPEEIFGYALNDYAQGLLFDTIKYVLSGSDDKQCKKASQLKTTLPGVLMRTITPLQIMTFLVMLAFILIFGLIEGYMLVGWLALGEFRSIALILAIVVCIYLSAFAVYRIFLRCFPLKEGEILAGSREEFAAQVNILFYLMLFNSLIRTHFLPLPLLRLVYLALGARLGPNTYSAGVLLDPPLTTAGKNCVIGHDAVVFAHVIEGNRFALAPVHLGDNVTIGATAVVMAGVTIGDGAIVSVGAVVLKGTQIGAGEVWGGMPARRLKP